MVKFALIDKQTLVSSLIEPEERRVSTSAKDGPSLLPWRWHDGMHINRLGLGWSGLA
jgi:hypothetical protein